ncbi:helix-turn-helix domain-containing protein [Rhizobium sp. P007]|uniref:helix-turn-helix domain-containing protein n=1 Tax=Rhizobium sp. P007 TaxID=285908 RepID=UPI001157E51F|nr:helix-turn-helix domain-containing protein [Rhizobium sp. P007]CAD7058262.1 hypothetical protein RP007_05794 [Rhizobium sp. P007]
MDRQAFNTLYETLTADLGMTEREIRQHLPPLLGSIAAAAGLPIALEVIEHFGGRKIYVPLNPNADCLFVRALGSEAAETVISAIEASIVACYNRVSFSNPFGSRFIVKRKAVKALKGGWSSSDVAAHYKLSLSTIKALKNELGLPKHTKNVHPMRGKVIQMLDDGMSVIETSKATGVHTDTIYRWRRERELSA